MARIITLGILIASLFISSCTVNRLSSIEFQEVKTEIIEGSYDDVFASTLGALREKGFQINLISRHDGGITAMYRFAPGQQPQGEFFEGYRPRLARTLRADITLKQLDLDKVLVDLTFFEELPPPATTYNNRTEDSTYREIRSGQKYEVMFNTIRSQLELTGP